MTTTWKPNTIYLVQPIGEPYLDLVRTDFNGAVLMFGTDVTVTPEEASRSFVQLRELRLEELHPNATGHPIVRIELVREPDPSDGGEMKWAARAGGREARARLATVAVDNLADVFVREGTEQPAHETWGAVLSIAGRRMVLR